MSQITDLKSGVDTQFRTALDLVSVARELNGVRNRLAEEGRLDDAEDLRRSITRLANLSESLIEAAKLSGRSLADAVRTAW